MILWLTRHQQNNMILVMVLAQVWILGGYFVAKLNVLNYLLLSEINLHMDVLVGWTESYLIMLSQTI